MKDAQKLNLNEFLKKHAYGPRSYLFDNYQTRALSQISPTREFLHYLPAEDILPDALKYLGKEYSLVGIREESNLVRAAISSILGLAYESCESDHLNVTNSIETMKDEIEDAKDILTELTRQDNILYKYATDIFNSRHRKDALNYSEKRFEQRHGANAVTRLHGKFEDGNTVFSVRDTLVASGIHGRDASGSPGCTVWSGPASRFVLYMPVPPGADLTLSLWLRGTASPTMLQNLLVEVDDKPAEYVVAPAQNWAAEIMVRAKTKRSFVKFAIDVGEAMAHLLGGEHVDHRKRGLAFGAYGWRFNL